MPQILIDRGKLNVIPRYRDKSGNDIIADVMVDRNDAEWDLRTRLGFQVWCENYLLECRICQEMVFGPEHLSTVEHQAKRRELELLIPGGDTCEGCPNLIHEDNPFNGMRELVCRLGYPHKGQNIDDELQLDYAFSNELIRPELCIRKHGRVANLLFAAL